MTLTLEIPDSLLEEICQNTDGDVSQQFIEAWAALAYSTGRASTGKLARLLGMDRLALVKMLGKAGVFPGNQPAEVERDDQTLTRLLDSCDQ